MGKIFDKKNYDRKSLVEVIQQFGLDLKCCAQQIKRGFSDPDVWGMRTWFCRTVPAMLDKMSEKAHGTPEKIANLPRFSGNPEAAHREWVRILKKTAFLLRESDEETAERKIDNPFDLRTQTENYLHFEKRKLAYREKCRKEGMTLFSYWFNDLWD
ncbi:MAG: hypothetical protein IJR90_09225 [Clostridia bacterium]|nr:hypothetical protein [Clostridia bacterium]